MGQVGSRSEIIGVWVGAREGRGKGARESSADDAKQGEGVQAPYSNSTAQAV